MSTVVDLAVFGLIAGITYALMSEGLWGAALMFFNALFASLIAFNFYEPVAQLIIDNASFAANFADSLSLMLLFVISLFLLRMATESLAPAMVRFPTPLYHLGRVVFGLGGAVIVMAILLLGYQVSPVQKKMLGVWDYKHKPLNLANFGRFDRDYLAFFQYTTGYTFARNGDGDPDPAREFPNKPKLFDPRGEWLLVHQLARPYGTEAILEEPPGEGGTATTGGATGGEAAASTPKPGMPGPGIPGGTAGAAAGLAPTNP